MRNIEQTIKGELHNLNQKRIQNIEYRRWHADSLPKRAGVLPLTAAEKTEVDRIWKPFQYDGRDSYVWHELYKSVHGSFNPEMVPGEAFYMNLVPKLNNRVFSTAWNDKGYTARIFQGLDMPVTAAVCIDGRYYDADYRYIAPDEILGHLKAFGEKVLVKPSVRSGQGKGIKVFDPSAISFEELNLLAKERDSNCIFQLLIRQSSQLAALNKDSVNVLRINTIRLGSEIIPLNTSIRFGLPGMVTDVCRDAEGNEVLNILGVTDAGMILDKVYSIEGNTRPVGSYADIQGTHLEGYEQAIALCKEAHSRMHHFDFVGFDIAIDAQYKPLLIEANTRRPGIFAYQYAHGPLFREYLPEVLAYCSTKK